MANFVCSGPFPLARTASVFSPGRGVGDPVLQEVRPPLVGDGAQDQSGVVPADTFEPELHEALLQVERVVLEVVVAGEVDGVLPAGAEGVLAALKLKKEITYLSSRFLNN